MSNTTHTATAATDASSGDKYRHVDTQLLEVVQPDGETYLSLLNEYELDPVCGTSTRYPLAFQQTVPLDTTRSFDGVWRFANTRFVKRGDGTRLQLIYRAESDETHIEHLQDLACSNPEIWVEDRSAATGQCDSELGSAQDSSRVGLVTGFKGPSVVIREEDGKTKTRLTWPGRGRQKDAEGYPYLEYTSQSPEMLVTTLKDRARRLANNDLQSEGIESAMVCTPFWEMVGGSTVGFVRQMLEGREEADPQRVFHITSQQVDGLPDEEDDPIGVSGLSKGVEAL